MTDPERPLPRHRTGRPSSAKEKENGKSSDRWYQVSLSSDSPLDRYYDMPGFLGAVEHDDHTILYFEGKPEIFRQIKHLHPSIVTKGDWEERWRDYFRPLPFAGFTVVPPWLADQGDLIINPGEGFGTGHHETTALCGDMLRSLLTDRTISSLLDVGTGSGILAIAAKKMRPDLRVTAIDNDPDALRNAAENIEMNGLTGAIALSTTPLSRLRKRYDIVVANIISSTLIALSPHLQQKTLRYLLLSGILHTEQRTFPALMNFDGFRLASSVRRGEWMAFLFEGTHGPREDRS